MATKKFLVQDAGKIKENLTIDSSAGAGSAGEMISLDAAGRIAENMMPVGIVPLKKAVVAFEALAAGDFVNIFDDGGTVKSRKADATDPLKRATGFVVAAVAAAASGDVYFEDFNSQVSGLTIGVEQYLSTTPGEVTDTPPSAAGNITQRLGMALSTTEMSVEIAQPIELI